MPKTIMLAGITGYESKRYFVKIPNTAHPATDGNNIHSINSKRYVLNFIILKISACKGNAYSGLSKSCFQNVFRQRNAETVVSKNTGTAEKDIRKTSNIFS
jgi:hypothetical protein